MGSGQSKFGRGNKNAQYAYGYQPYSQYSGATQQPFIPPYGAPGGFIPPGQAMFPPQMQQYGVIPPEFYGQAAYNRPPRMMGWLPQDKPVKKKKQSKRTHSENFVGGFAGEAPAESTMPLPRTSDYFLNACYSATSTRSIRVTQSTRSGWA